MTRRPFARIVVAQAAFWALVLLAACEVVR
jgi:hypothetical protein